jgi:hypothetical protein
MTDPHIQTSMIITGKEYTEMQAEITRLRERLEIDTRHPYDGIYCRDETIRLQDAEIARLKAEVERKREIIKEAVYEVTHLSPEELDGSHWARISAEWLQKARAALTPSQEPRT